MTNPVYDAAAHEEDPDLEVGISINRLTKIFGGLVSHLCKLFLIRSSTFFSFL